MIRIDKNLSDDTDRRKHEKLINIQQSEAKLHWQRNNIFLIVTSIMMLAMSQFESKLYQIAIAMSALFLNIVWFLIQYSSNILIKKWIDQIQEIEKNLNIAKIFTGEPKGLPIRKLAYLVPLIFILLWIFITILLIFN